MNWKTPLAVLLACLIAGSVAANPEEPDTAPEAISFAGVPLYRAEVPVDVRATTWEQIAGLEAKADKSEEDYVDLGHLYMALGRFQGAIDLYTRGIADYPDSFKLLRHRGHRYLNTRQLEKAIVDLDRARALIEQEDDPAVPEFRASGEPFATYEHWIWYHIGLHRYMTEDYDGAAEAWERCTRTATNDGYLAGSADWLWNSYQKAGRPEAAAAVLDRLPEGIGAGSSSPYVQRIRVYRGELDPDGMVDVDKPGTEWTGMDVTLGYGIANWYGIQGDEALAQKMYERILASSSWSSWAYVVTDREQALREARMSARRP